MASGVSFGPGKKDEGQSLALKVFPWLKKPAQLVTGDRHLVSETRIDFGGAGHQMFFYFFVFHFPKKTDLFLFFAFPLCGFREGPGDKPAAPSSSRP